MRSRIAIVAALAAGLLSVGAAAQAATTTTPSPAATSSATSAMDMPGMNMPTVTATKTTPEDRDAAIRRASLKPLFLEAQLAGRNEVQVPGKPPVGDPNGSATGIVRVQGDRVTFSFTWKGISPPNVGHIHQGVAGVNGDI